LKFLLRILRFLNIVDEQDRLSITNLAVYIALAKLALTPATPMDMGVLFTSLLNYAHKRHTNSQGDSDDEGRLDSPETSDSAKPGTGSA
jgi:hypothetical protein